MNIKKILIISLFLLILASVTIGTSHAASSEKISASSCKITETFNKKIASIYQVYTSNENGGKLYYKINIKKSFQNKYKILSVKCRYDDYGTTGPFYKIYDGKNKNSLIIKPYNDSNLELMTINYQTKDKIKKESSNFWENRFKVLRVSKFVGKKANLKLKEKGYYSEEKSKDTYITYQKINIKTINKNYKIKTIKAVYYDSNNRVSKTLTFKGKGKTTFTKVIKGNFSDKKSFLYEFKITYY